MSEIKENFSQESTYKITDQLIKDVVLQWQKNLNEADLENITYDSFAAEVFELLLEHFNIEVKLNEFPIKSKEGKEGMGTYSSDLLFTGDPKVEEVYQQFFKSQVDLHHLFDNVKRNVHNRAKRAEKENKNQ